MSTNDKEEELLTLLDKLLIREAMDLVGGFHGSVFGEVEILPELDAFLPKCMRLFNVELSCSQELQYDSLSLFMFPLDKITLLVGD
jgi:hypothetical protein